jgi:hypothetical protein
LTIPVGIWYIYLLEYRIYYSEYITSCRKLLSECKLAAGRAVGVMTGFHI